MLVGEKCQGNGAGREWAGCHLRQGSQGKSRREGGFEQKFLEGGVAAPSFSHSLTGRLSTSVLGLGYKYRCKPHLTLGGSGCWLPAVG